MLKESGLFLAPIAETQLKHRQKNWRGTITG